MKLGPEYDFLMFYIFTPLALYVFCSGINRGIDLVPSYVYGYVSGPLYHLPGTLVQLCRIDVFDPRTLSLSE